MGLIGHPGMHIFEQIVLPVCVILLHFYTLYEMIDILISIHDLEFFL